MADLGNEIDDIFSQRFADFKDLSVDPAAQWAGFESQLSGTASTSAATASNSLSSFSILAKAASFVGVAATATFLSGDVSKGTIAETNDAGQKHSTQIENSYALDSKFLDEFSPLAYPSQVERKSVGESSLGSSSEHFVQIASNPDNGSIALDARSEASQVGVAEGALEKDGATWSSMELLPLLPAFTDDGEKEPILNPMPLAAQVIFDKNQPNSEIYLRGGLKANIAESNMGTPLILSANGEVSVGYSVPVSRKFRLAFEVGYVRFSQQALERRTELSVDISDLLYQADEFVNSMAEMPVREMNIQESRVAKITEYLRMPLIASYQLEKAGNVYVGGYLDVLLRSVNDFYWVYNDEFYVSVPSALHNATHDNLLLSKTRVGLAAGFDYPISTRVNLDMRMSMPISAALEPNTRVSVPALNPSLTVGVRYAIR